MIVKLKGKATKPPASRTRRQKASPVKSGRIAKSAPKSKLSQATQADPQEVSSTESDSSSSVRESAYESTELGNDAYLGVPVVENSDDEEDGMDVDES